MPVAEVLDDRRIIVQTAYHERELVQSLPGARFDDGMQRWTVPLTWASCIQLRGVFGFQLEFGPNILGWAAAVRRGYIEPSLAWRTQVDAPGDDKLYSFQRAGVIWLQHVRRGILADEMGTGKTIQAIMFLAGLVGRPDEPPFPFPALIIVPNSIKRKWQREFNTWYPGVRVSIVSGSARQRLAALEPGIADVYVINWEAVRLHSRLAPYGSIRLKRCRGCGGSETVSESSCEVHMGELNMMGFRTVIADEAHRLFDPHSKWTRAVWAVGHSDSVEYRWALTGTPLANAPDDLWGILHFVDPISFPSRTKYIDRYCFKSWNMWGGMDIIGVRPETAVEFYAVIDPLMRRMPKALVLPYLPPKLRDVRDAPLPPKQMKAYKEMEKLVTQLDDGGVVMASNNLVKNTRLMQFSSAYAMVDEAGDVKLTEPSSKLDVLEEILLELGWTWVTKTAPAKIGAPVVVFAESRQLIELAALRMIKHGVRHWALTGGMSDDQREHVIDEFNALDGVLLVVIKAGGEGLDFTRAGHCVFLQRSWSMLSNLQAEDRVHRIGSEIHDKIEIIDVIAPDTVEEGQVLALHEKFRRLQEIVRDKETLRVAGDFVTLQQLEYEETTIMRSGLA